MKRTVPELTNTIKELMGGQTPDGLESFLEDITDSVGIPEGYRSPDEYSAMEQRALKAEADSKNMRDRYINRFYQDYNKPGNQGFIMSEAAQQDVQNEEKRMRYEDLFE